MEEILHQLREVVFRIIYKVLYIPDGDRRISEPSTVSGDPVNRWINTVSKWLIPMVPMVTKSPK